MVKLTFHAGNQESGQYSRLFLRVYMRDSTKSGQKWAKWANEAYVYNLVMYFMYVSSSKI